MLRKRFFSAVALATFLAASIFCTASYGAVIADSVSGWSPTGIQGENGWLFGWRNFTADGGGDYNHEANFIPFINDFSDGATPRDYLGERPNLTNNWQGEHWRLQDSPGDSGGPWTELFEQNSHPNGTNSTGAVEEHWTIRRWIADIPAAQTLELRSNLVATNTNCGNGTTVNLYQNSTLLDTLTTNASAGVTNSVVHTINPNDVIDIALTPAGADAARGDSCDGSSFSLTISEDDGPPPPVGAQLGDSFDDWSTTGTQGEKNWFNGYYNLTQDTDGTYGVDDFTPFLNDGSNNVNPDGANHWNGSDWRLYRDTSPNTGPWTSLGQESTHPNGTNSAAPPSVPGSVPEEHWTMRRYVVGDSLLETIPVALEWHMRETNDGGSGVGGMLFINGVEVDSGATDDTTGFTRTYFADVSPGDVIDLALTPVGLDGDRADGADGSANRLTISMVPEPSSALTLMIGLGILGWLRRRQQ